MDRERLSWNDAWTEKSSASITHRKNAQLRKSLINRKGLSFNKLNNQPPI